MLKNILYVGIGGFFGSSLRYIISKLLNSSFPFGTLFVNAFGSFILGFITYKLIKSTNIPQEYILMFTTGFIGAFTTFSTYMLESHIFLAEDKIFAGIVNISSNLILGLFLVHFGYQLAKSI
jgi:CrcB protein